MRFARLHDPQRRRDFLRHSACLGLLAALPLRGNPRPSPGDPTSGPGGEGASGASDSAGVPRAAGRGGLPGSASESLGASESSGAPGPDRADARASAEAHGSAPHDVGTFSQLFIDDFLVASSTGLSARQHQARKHPANPLLVADQPWEHRWVQIYGDVRYDASEGLFRMWYITDTGDLFPERSNTCLATSRDGIRWEKPLIGTVPSRTGIRTNVVMKSVELASVIHDPSDPDPSRRYKAICWIDSGPDRGALTLVSPDGLTWRRYSPGRIFECSDVVTGFRDPRSGRYVALLKVFADIGGARRRVFDVSTSTDFLNWSQPEPALRPDARDDAGSAARIERIRSLLTDAPDDPAALRTEFYGSGFYAAESCIVGFPWIFTINRETGPHSRSNVGGIDLQLAVSRDFKHWERPFRTSCLPQEPGAWDEGMVVTQSQAVRFGDEIRLYYAGMNHAHGMSKQGGGIGLASWKLDRFVSRDAADEAGTLTTIPLVFGGDRLEVNADVGAAGVLTVEPLDLDGRPIPGFGPSEPVRGDSLRHSVSWRGGPITALRGRPLRLRFRLQRASLFAFAFRAAA